MPLSGGKRDRCTLETEGLRVVAHSLREMGGNLFLPWFLLAVGVGPIGDILNQGRGGGLGEFGIGALEGGAQARQDTGELLHLGIGTGLPKDRGGTGDLSLES